MTRPRRTRSSRTHTAEPRVTTNIRLPPDVHQRLFAAAEERDVSTNFIVERAIRRYLSTLKPIDELEQ